MSLIQFLNSARAIEPIEFTDVMAMINAQYRYTPTAFSNGVGEKRQQNAAGQNEGSCKLLAFAKLHQLNKEQTLNLFGQYYHQEVLQDPAGSSHMNIRAFMADGWDGVSFDTEPLAAGTK
ncbi:MAG: HopJ type III effector protein [Motiliproteus sp.]